MHFYFGINLSTLKYFCTPESSPTGLGKLVCHTDRLMTNSFLRQENLTGYISENENKTLLQKIGPFPNKKLVKRYWHGYLKTGSCFMRQAVGLAYAYYIIEPIDR